jgi:hypothetical protein
VSPEEHRISNGEMSRLVYKHDKDLYDGDKHAPGLTIRIAILETTLDRINKNLSKIVWLIVGGIGTGIVAFIVDLAVRAK